MTHDNELFIVNGSKRASVARIVKKINVCCCFDVAPSFEQCSTSPRPDFFLTLHAAIRVVHKFAFPANGGMFSQTLQMFKHRFFWRNMSRIVVHSYHKCNVDPLFATDQQF